MYCPVFPGSFATFEDARAFCDVFFTYYNNDHIPGSGCTPCHGALRERLRHPRPAASRPATRHTPPVRNGSCAADR